MERWIDFSDFEKGLEKLVQESVPEDIDRGLFRAANQLLDDAIYVIPKAPFDEGHLRGSARTQGAGNILYKPRAEPPKGFKGKRETEGISIQTGFNIVYAARWHELTPAEDAKINWTLPGSGRKYLESKMSMFKEDYLKIFAMYLRKRLGSK